MTYAASNAGWYVRAGKGKAHYYMAGSPMAYCGRSAVQLTVATNTDSHCGACEKTWRHMNAAHVDLKAAVDEQCVLRVEARDVVMGNEEPDRYIVTLPIEVLAVTDDEREHNVGRALAHIVCVGQMLDEEQDVLEACDAHSQDLLELGECVWLEDSPDEQFLELGDVLYLDRLELKREVRGNGLGLRVIKALMSELGAQCQTAMMYPYPLDSRSLTKEQIAEAVGKLTVYYRQLGFERWGETRYYYRKL
jgi:GNAT superfamily N-acetyltransferase